MAAVALAGAGYWAFSRGPSGSPSRAEKPPSAGLSPVPEAPAEVVTGPETLIVLKTLYANCAEEATGAEVAGVGLAGLGRQELEKRFPGWDVETFRPGQVVLRKVVDGPCPEEVQYRTIGIREGKVVVFAGRPEQLGPVLRDTAIPASRLLPADREKLARGIVVRGEADVWRILEGLDLE